MDGNSLDIRSTVILVQGWRESLIRHRILTCSLSAFFIDLYTTLGVGLFCYQFAINVLSTTIGNETCADNISQIEIRTSLHCQKLPFLLLLHSLDIVFIWVNCPPASEASREVPNFTERKNPHTPLFMLSLPNTCHQFLKYFMLK